MRIGRFQVMAVLQAARASILGVPLSRAKGWGINRAIFYAAAKRGFKALPTRRIAKIPVTRVPARQAQREGVFHLGDEVAYTTKVGRETQFTIGGEVQTEEDYDRQIASRFGDKYGEARKEALKMVGSFPKSVLSSQNEFFHQVYRPVRDELSGKWMEMVASE